MPPCLNLTMLSATGLMQAAPALLLALWHAHDRPLPSLPVQANLGVEMRCLDPGDDAPAAVAAQHTQGHFRDASAVADFAAGVDVLTVEIEHIDASAMSAVAARGHADVEPTPETLAIIQVRCRMCRGGGGTAGQGREKVRGVVLVYVVRRCALAACKATTAPANQQQLVCVRLCMQCPGLLLPCSP
jgi:hypothetical protein